MNNLNTNIEGSNKLLILGSDYGTIDLLKAAKARGLYVIVTDLMTSSPTKDAADEAWMISTADIDLLERKCREENIGAILTGASDFNIEKSRELCKRLGFPVYCENDKAWDVATNKRLFKDICKQVGAPIATDYKLTDELSDEELKAIKFPVVVKPVDLSGNRGMSYCSNKEELRDAWKKAREISHNSTIIVERQLHGPEFAVNYIMADGEIRLHFFSSEHHEPSELSNLYSVIDTTSYHLKQYIEEVNDKVIEVFKEAGCREGVAWVETMLDEDGHFYLLEMGYRYGGEVVNSAYRHICGFDSIDWMVEIACGVKHTAVDLPDPLTECYRGIGSAYLLFAKCDDVIRTIEGLEEVEKLPNVYLDIPKREGGNVRFHATMGVIHIVSKDIEELCSTIDFINKTLRIKSVGGQDMFIYYTNLDELRNEYYNGLKEFGLK